MKKAFFASIALLMTFLFSLLLGYQNIQANPGTATPTRQSVPTSTPALFATISPDTKSHWLTYTNTQYQFHFNYPDSLKSFGAISGPVTSNPVAAFNLADPNTGMPFSDAPFDGLNVYVVPILNGETFDSYIAQEKAQLIYWERVWRKTEIASTCSQEIIMEPTGLLWTHLIGCFSDIGRYYALFPDGKRVLVVSRVSSTPGFPEVFDYILSTFRFDR